MSVLVVAGARGAPGATTVALLLAAVWPRRAVLVDADTGGGDLRCRLPGPDGVAPLPGGAGLLGLAATSDTGPDVAGFVQSAAGGLPVLLGPETRAQGRALGSAWPRVGAALAGVGDDVIVDVGQALDPAQGPLLAAAGLLLVVCRAEAGSVRRASDTAAELAAAGSPVGLVVVGVSGDAARVRDALPSGPPVVGVLAWDPGAVAALAGAWGRRLDRSALVGSARALAQAVDALLRDSSTPARDAAAVGEAAPGVLAGVVPVGAAAGLAATAAAR